MDQKNELTSLPALAKGADEHYHLAESHRNQALAHAQEAGRLLIEAKRLVKDEGGGWEKWVQANTVFSPRTASRWMRLYENRDLLPEVDDEGDPLSPRKAIALLKATKAESESDTCVRSPNRERKLCDYPFREWPEEKRREWVRQYWGWETVCSQTFLCSAIGWSPEETAEMLTIDVDDVNRILCPVAPTRFDTPENSIPIDGPEGGFAERYRREVEEHINSILSHHVPVGFGNDVEQLPDSASQELEATRKMLTRRAKLLGTQGNVFTDPPFEEHLANATWRFLVDCDARAALGLDNEVFYPGELCLAFEVMMVRFSEIDPTVRPTRDDYVPASLWTFNALHRAYAREAERERATATGEPDTGPDF